MTAWTYKGKEISDDMIPSVAIGFIYMITQISTGKKYIGRKLLTQAGTKTVNGKKKKVRKESDWKSYWSSSPKIKAWIDEAGNTDDFTREILVFVTSKGSLAAAEEMALYSVGALESDEWCNENIRSKVYSSWIKPNEMEELRSALKSLHIYK